MLLRATKGGEKLWKYMIAHFLTEIRWESKYTNSRLNKKKSGLVEGEAYYKRNKEFTK